MRYHVRERLWSLTEDFVVRDDAGNPVFEIRGKFFHIGENLVLFDRYTGQELVQIKQQILSLMPTYNIYRNGQHLAHVHEQIFHLFGERFKIEGSNGVIFHIDGDLWNWNFGVTDNYGNLLGRISRQLSLFRDSYAVEVASGVDAPFIISLAIVLEMVKESKQKDR